MSILRSWRALSLGGLIVLGATTAAGADDSLSTARDLYAAAAYEDALAVLNRLSTPEVVPEDGRAIGQYRAFCLLALGRVAEAEHAIEALVTAEPSYHPADADASPRVRSAFSDVRRRMLPAIVQQQYVQAKAAYDRKEFLVAALGFKQVVGMLNDPDLRSAANQPPLSDLRTLAAGFSELSASAAAPLASPLPAQSLAAADPPLLVGATSPQTPSARRIYSSDDGNVVQPAVVRQTLPAFQFLAHAQGQGAVSLIVDENGAVETATMLGSLNAPYDSKILEAARQWRYKPATLDGVPVRYRRIVQINLVPDR